MKSALIALALSFVAGCAGIEKPDFNPGNTPPKVYVGERPKCPLLAEWAWSAEFKDWICVKRPIYYGQPYYGPAYIYPPQVYVAPIVVYPPPIYYTPCCYGIRRDGKWWRW